MKRIVLLRHGQSTWNKENRFTGWTDVDLSQEGVAEAVRAGESCSATKASPSEKPIPPTSNGRSRHSTACWTSWTKRGFRSKSHGGSTKKHYGMLQGAQQERNSRKIRREEQVHVWRRSYDVAPRPAARGRPAQPAFRRALRLRSRRRTAAHRIARTDDRTHPALLALRRLPVADAVRQPAGRRTRQFAARRHQASQRNPRRPDRRAQPADGRVPYVFEFDDALRLVRDYYLGDPEEIRRRAEAVARQGSAR